MKMIARRVGERARLLYLKPPWGGSSSAEVFGQRLAACTGANSAREALMTPLPDDCVLMLDDVQLWWERSEHGGAVLDALGRFIQRSSGAGLIMLGVDDRPFHFMDRLYHLQEHILGVVASRPLDAEDLQQAVLSRHESTGLTLTVQGTPEAAMSDWAYARLFTRLFRYTGGNVGDCLHAWVSHIESADASGIHLRRPEMPDLEALDSLRPMQIALIVQCILHGQLTRTRLARITSADAAEMRAELAALIRLGVVVEHSGGVFGVNPFLEPHILRRFGELRYV